ncbi:glycerophosphodiester phosphodiesterase family protein [Rhabdaerophilum sp. SD176]|uniref:glycerophosphodiester phosphodiesterase family protein n=1 Tax=Rhabdaerophilum sp. SD176 TaxID=2983548 RepID=UPI0024DFBBED|nr:glycerophosphodiester phosphodiesterase family protein [Rhabdaerophilum sp. SD176]
MYTPLPLPAGFLDRPIAHRGFHDAAAGRLENTRAAFVAAIEAGYGIECDIQLSADGEAVVFHDFTLDRLTVETGRVDARPAAALAAIPFRRGEHGIESLAALLALVAGKVPLVVEVKSRFNGDDTLARAALAVLQGYAGPAVLKSFDPGVLVALRKAGAQVPLGIVATSSYDDPEAGLDEAGKFRLANLLHLPESEPDFVSWNQAAIPSAAPFLSRFGLGLPLMSWTVRDQATADRLRPHVDQIVFEGFTPA